MNLERLAEIQYLARRLNWLINDKQGEEPKMECEDRVVEKLEKVVKAAKAWKDAADMGLGPLAMTNRDHLYEALTALEKP